MFFVFAVIVFSFFIYLLARYLSRGIEIKEITKRSVLVTGCDSGFGKILVELLDTRGVRVFAGCLTERGVNDLKKDVSRRTAVFQIDIIKRDSVLRVLHLVNLHSNGELWGLVNNAGVMPTLAPVEWTTMEDYEYTCDVNLFGTIFVTKTFLPLIRKSKGRIVNVCSAMNDCAIPGLSSYLMSKPALNAFTKCLRCESCNFGVTVHAIQPGGYQTNITNGNRLCKIYKHAYKRADLETQDVYGGSISSCVLKTLPTATKYTSTQTRQVPDAIIHALFAKYPNQEYLVGLDARIFSFIPSLMGYLFCLPKPYGPRSNLLEENI